jgi:hypothetical protein
MCKLTAKAQYCELKVTELGLEFWLAGQRPAVFDDFYDVSEGKWETGRSSIPVFVWEDLNAVWGVAGGNGNQGQGQGEHVVFRVNKFKKQKINRVSTRGYLILQIREVQSIAAPYLACPSELYRRKSHYIQYQKKIQANSIIYTSLINSTILLNLLLRPLPELLRNPRSALTLRFRARVKIRSDRDESSPWLD